MWYSIDGRVTPAAKVQALSPTGGNEGSWTGYVAVLPNTVKDVSLWATAEDLGGHESDRSEVTTITVDRRTTKRPMPPK